MKCFSNIFFFLYISFLCSAQEHQQQQFVKVTDINHYISGHYQTPVVILSFEIDSGYHIQPDILENSNFIPSIINIENSDLCIIQKQEFKYEKKLWTFDDANFFEVITDKFKVIITLNCSIDHLLDINQLNANLYYQACDEKNVIIQDAYLSL